MRSMLLPSISGDGVKSSTTRNGWFAAFATNNLDLFWHSVLPAWSGSDATDSLSAYARKRPSGETSRVVRDLWDPINLPVDSSQPLA